MAAQPRHFVNTTNAPYLSNGSPTSFATSGSTGVPAGPGAAPLLPNQGRVVQSGSSRVLCVADVRGNLTSLNELARSARADCVIHTGDFGFYDERSLERIADKTLKHVAQYSPLISEDVRRQISQTSSLASLKDQIPRQQLSLSQLPLFLNGTYKFEIPVYAVWGACEDVQVLEKLRSGEYKIDRLHILDEAHSRLLETGGVKLRLLGLGGAVVMHKLFDNGEGRTTIAGGQGTMWTTLLQMGELVDTANRTYDPSETRIFVTHASPAREGLLNQLAVALKADFSISGGLHFRYGSSYNEFSVNPTLDHFRGKLAASKASFQDVWDTVKSEVEPMVAENEAHNRLLRNALDVVEKMPAVANGSNPFGGSTGASTGQVDEAAFKNMWNFNLADAAFGWLVLDIEAGRIGTEMRALGFNFAHRSMKANHQVQDSLKATATLPTTSQGSTIPQISQQPISNQVPSRPAQQRATQSQQPSTHPQQNHSTHVATMPSSTADPHSPAPQQSSGPIAASKPVAALATNGGKALQEQKQNGSTTPGPAERAAKATPPPTEKKTSSGIYVENVLSEDEVRKMFSSEDQTKIRSIERMGHNTRNWAVQFDTPEMMQAVLNGVSPEFKTNPSGKPRMKVFDPRPRQAYAQRTGQQSGYRSGGERATSDSEGTNRGSRGGFRGTRGVPRGNDRGRGGRGRGNFARSDGIAGPPTTMPSSGPP